MEEDNPKQFMVTDELLATLSQRFLNWFFDTVIQVLLFLFLFTIIATIAHSYGNKELPGYLLVNPVGQYTFVSIIRLVYYISMETLFGRTVGKFVTNTIVVDENGNIPSHQVVLIRTLCRLIPFYELSFFGIPTRAWHDRISKTYVVDKRKLDQGKR
jgi:uncharacterized RDD family membrane protein YckC